MDRLAGHGANLVIASATRLWVSVSEGDSQTRREETVPG